VEWKRTGTSYDKLDDELDGESETEVEDELVEQEEEEFVEQEEEEDDEDDKDGEDDEEDDASEHFDLTLWSFEANPLGAVLIKYRLQECGMRSLTH